MDGIVKSEGSSPSQHNEDNAVPMLPSTSHMNYEPTGVIQMRIENRPPPPPQMRSQFEQHRPPVVVAVPSSSQCGSFAGNYSPSNDVVYDLRAPFSTRTRNISEEDDSSADTDIEMHSNDSSNSSEHFNVQKNGITKYLKQVGGDFSFIDFLSGCIMFCLKQSSPPFAQNSLPQKPKNYGKNFPQKTFPQN